MDKIYQCGIYGKGYKPQDMTTMFYYGMNLDSVYNYVAIPSNRVNVSYLSLIHISEPTRPY